MTTITGPKDAVLAARALDDAASRLPSQVAPCIACGKIAGLDVIDDATDLVTCRGCGHVQSALGIATLRVYRDEPDPAGAKCVVTDETGAKITDAKATAAKAPKDAGGKAIVDGTTAKLASCIVESAPIDGGKVPVK